MTDGATGPVGIKDVARVAKVSVGTVSNVLNKPEVVSEGRRQRVLAAIEDLGYVPNEAARLLKAGVSRTVGLVVLDTLNPFYGSVALAVEDAAEERGLGVFVASSHQRKGKEDFYLKQFAQQGARGILVAPTSSDYESLSGIADRGTRIILVDAAVATERFCSVSVDDLHGGEIVMRHLIERGARRIALIGGEDLLPQVAARRRGALTAAADLRGVELEYLASSEMSILAGRSLADELVTRRGPKPDAILAMNDLLAIGALQALVMNHRLDVPGSLMLTGYDDIDFCSNAVVPITSVRQPSFELGKRALELLEKEIVEGEEHGHVAVVLKPELVTRQSTQRAGRN